MMLGQWRVVAPHNVLVAYVFTLFFSAARSILFQEVVAGYVFVLTQSNKPVGLVKGLQGISQLLFSVPGGYLADRTRRDTALRLAGALGLVAAVPTLLAVHLRSLLLLCLAFALWGLFAAFQSPAMEALFADSLPTGQRSFPFTIKYSLGNLAQMLGPALSIVLFTQYGDEWQLAQLTPVLQFGTLLAVVGSLLLFWFNDDLTVVTHVRLQEEDDGDDGEGADSISLAPASPLLTPTMAEDGFDLEYVYSDKEDEAAEAGVATETTALLLQSGVEGVDEETEGYLARVDAQFMCFRTKHVPLLLFVSDFVICNGAGMTTNFYPLFFKEEYGLSPISVCALFMSLPLTTMLSSFAAQLVSTHCGRAPIIVVTHMLAVVCLFAMAYAQPLPLQLVLFLVRGGLMRCSLPLRRALLMDYVPKSVRGRWNALEALTVFSWSGSAVLGGFLVDAHGYRSCFTITGTVYCAAIVLELFLLPLTKHAVEK